SIWRACTCAPWDCPPPLFAKEQGSIPEWVISMQTDQRTDNLPPLPVLRGAAADLKSLAASVAWQTPAAEPIPFNRFCKTGAEFGYIQRAIDQMHISGDGEFTARCSEYLESCTGAGK